jgi:hypothetical protein
MMINMSICGNYYSAEYHTVFRSAAVRRIGRAPFAANCISTADLIFTLLEQLIYDAIILSFPHTQ